VLRTETTLTVNIIDENDEVPTFTQLEYYRDVTENNDINMTLITMVAIDRYNLMFPADTSFSDGKLA